MIVTFSANAEEFAASRRKVISDAEEQLRPHVEEAAGRIGLPGWEIPLVAAALDLFDVTARAEVDAWSQVIDEMRDAFELELARALAATKRGTSFASQVDTLTRWVAQMAHNAAMEAATTSDPDEKVGLEWVCMEDSDVRAPHREAHGQRVPTGMAFEVGGVELLYPGQPVGDPSNWINCRCVARPTILEGFADVSRETFGVRDISDLLDPAYKARLIEKYSGTDVDHSDVSRETFAADPEQVFTTATIMALPAESDPVNAASSEEIAHCTLLFLGETENLDKNALTLAIRQFVEAGEVTPITDAVNGHGVLGAEGAQVLLLDAANLVHVRNGLLEDQYLNAAYHSVEQFPTWIPHVTIGWPDAPAPAPFEGEHITFDRIALWFGDDKSTVFTLGDVMPKKVVHAEDPEFTQEMANAFAATIEEDAPVTDAEPAEAAPAADAPAGEPELRKWHGVIAPEAAPSGDKRQFAERALSTRSLPLPLKAMFVDDEGHKGSVVVGRIDNVFRKNGLILADGVWDNSPEADRAYGMIERRMWRGVSVDLDAVEVDLEGMSDAEVLEFMAGRIASATLCAIPAFAEAFVGIGGWENFDELSAPTGAMNEIPDWPEATALVASAAVKKISADYFRNPLLEEPTPLSLGEDGHVFGHLAAWDACHIGFEVCTTAPPSATDYAYFLTGQVFTDAGPVAVGQITLGKDDVGGHAPDGISLRAAIAHYDRTGTAVADITVGEDEFGIWFSGKLRDYVTSEQIHKLFAAGLSGDWREVRFRGQSSMEMVAALAVNVQGFPIPRTSFAMDGDRQVSLVAAGVLRPKADAVLDPNFKAQMDLYLAQQKRNEEAAALVSQLRSMEYSHIVNEINRLERI